MRGHDAALVPLSLTPRPSPPAPPGRNPHVPSLPSRLAERAVAGIASGERSIRPHLLGAPARLCHTRAAAWGRRPAAWDRGHPRHTAHRHARRAATVNRPVIAVAATGWRGHGRRGKRG